MAEKSSKRVRGLWTRGTEEYRYVNGGDNYQIIKRYTYEGCRDHLTFKSGCLVINVPGRLFHLLLSTVMDSYPEVTQLWDLSHNSDLNQLQDNDFLALLQKQFPNTNDGGLFMAPYSNAINPQNLSSYPLPSLTPPSEDSSPSPANSNQDNANDDNNDSALKRKASDDDLSDGPTQKSQHTSGELLDLEMKIQSKNSWSSFPASDRRGSTGTARRKSTGGSATVSQPQCYSFSESKFLIQKKGKDEGRLMKRKEQNRAAQRAFRERKEKHVKDVSLHYCSIFIPNPYLKNITAGR